MAGDDSAVPRSPHDGTRMRPWLRVPGDRRRPSSDEEYQLYWSEEAAFGMIYPKPSAETLRRAYLTEDETYYTHGSTGSTEERRTFRERALESLAWRFDRHTRPDAAWISKVTRPSGRVCDVGSGSGNFLQTLVDAGMTGFGIEPDPNAVRNARQRGLSVYEGNAESLPAACEAEDPVDIVVMRHSLEHFVDPKAALHNIKTLLADDGLVLCEVPNNECLHARTMGAAWCHLGVPRHVSFFTQRSLRTLFKNEGFDVEHVGFYGYSRQFKPGVMAAEAAAYEFFKGRGGAHALPCKPSARSRAKLFAQTCLAPAERKYDSIALLARLR